MKAREIAQEIMNEGLKENEDYYANLIKRYAQLKCEQQRELCAEHGKDDKVEVDKETGDETLVEYSSDYLILSAPEPEFD